MGLYPKKVTKRTRIIGRMMRVNHYPLQARPSHDKQQRQWPTQLNIRFSPKQFASSLVPLTTPRLPPNVQAQFFRFSSSSVGNALELHSLDAQMTTGCDHLSNFFSCAEEILGFHCVDSRAFLTSFVQLVNTLETKTISLVDHKPDEEHTDEAGAEPHEEGLCKLA